MSGPGALTARLDAALRAPGAALLLDLDGTLVDSEPTHRAAFQTYFARRGWDVTDQMLHAFAGRRGAEVFASVEGPWTGEDPMTLAHEVIACLDVGRYPAAPVPGAAESVAGWRGAGVPVAVVTSATEAWATAALELLGVADLGVALVTAELVEVGKPDPAPYRLGAEVLGVDAAACVAAEDTPAGLAAARGAGVGLVLGVSTSHDDETLRRAGAHAVVPDLTELVPR
ncbi:HAD family hydrolase [Georgenia subflava]|uniref:HAD family hydrolase n=1 Tax=Georgenia subflava TaxID=1622177 RepID=UPI00186AC988|nr:HAD-IA family hydrolase [Georgenia subflava]